MPSSSKKKASTGIEKWTSPGIKALTLAAEAGKKGNYRLSIKILRELISETDAPPEAWLLLGRSLHALKDYSHALAAFNDYIRQRPYSGEGYLFAGRTYLSIGMPYKAVPFLRRALENLPKNSADSKSADSRTAEFKSKAKALLGAAYLKSKHSQAAVDLLQDAVETAPGDKRIYRAYLNSLLVRGIRLCGMADYELGGQMLRFVLANLDEGGMEESPILRLQLGRASRETGRLEEALEHFSAALELTGDKTGGKVPGDGKQEDSGMLGDRRIRWSRASILMAMGRTKEAIREIEIIRSQDADVPELPWNSELIDFFMIKSFVEAGEWRRATECCNEWLKNRDDKPIIRALNAEALRNLRNFKNAHNQLQKALEKEPEELDFWYADILVSWEGEDYKSLKKAIKAARSLGGDDAILQRFDILCQSRTSKDPFGNITLLQKAIHSLGPDPELMHAMGEAYLKVGLLEEAVSWFKKTISVKNDHESAWLGQIAAMEALHTAEGKAEGLSSLYKEYLELWPSNLDIRRDRAQFLIKILDYNEASSELEKLLVWEPSNRSLRRVLAYTYRKTGRYREAAVLLKYLLKEKPRDYGLLIEYSGCLDRAGATHYAMELLEKAKALFNQNSRKQELCEISLALGVLYFRQKNIKKAFDHFREAAAINPEDKRPYDWIDAIGQARYGPQKKQESGDNYHGKESQKRKK